MGHPHTHRSHHLKQSDWLDKENLINIIICLPINTNNGYFDTNIEIERMYLLPHQMYALSELSLQHNRWLHKTFPQTCIRYQV